MKGTGARFSRGPVARPQASQPTSRHRETGFAPGRIPLAQDTGFTAWPACTRHADRACAPGRLRGLKARPAVRTGRRARHPVLVREERPSAWCRWAKRGSMCR